MTNLLAFIDASTATTTATKKSSGSSSYELIIIVAIFAVVYFAFIRPRSRRQRAARTQGTPMDVGDRVMSVGGIYGTVVALHDAEGGADPTVEVEVAPGMVLTFLRRAVNPRPQVAVADDAAIDGPDDSYDEADDDGTYADPEPYGDFDEQGQFHEHGQTPAHDEAHGSDAEDGGTDGSEHDEEDVPAPGTPRSPGGTGPEGD